MAGKITLPNGQIIYLTPKQQRILKKNPEDMTPREKVVFLRIFLTVKGKVSD